jgi:NADP-dependent 3-hydroxy acid dehydrogenase YdfG
MMAKALNENSTSKVYILGRRMDKLEEVANAAVSPTLHFCKWSFLLTRYQAKHYMMPIKADVNSKNYLSTVAEIKSDVGFANVVIANSGTVGSALEGLPKHRTPSIEELQDYF